MDAEAISIIAKMKRNLMFIHKWLNKLQYDHVMEAYVAMENCP